MRSFDTRYARPWGPAAPSKHSGGRLSRALFMFRLTRTTLQPSERNLRAMLNPIPEATEYSAIGHQVINVTISTVI